MGWQHDRADHGRGPPLRPPGRRDAACGGETAGCADPAGGRDEDDGQIEAAQIIGDVSLLVAIGEHHPGTLEGATRAVLQAAARLGVVLGEHETVVARVRAAIGKLDGKLAAAQQLGDLRFFN
jgi:hypothetical protein